ncbi:hypothetical protein, partial [Rhizobium halophilum]|uniref:hypothetical protein n=1 Tax=Rhizobium halophilum TaxID=2846852 RepID=UPI001EFD6C5F
EYVSARPNDGNVGARLQRAFFNSIRQHRTSASGNVLAVWRQRETVSMRAEQRISLKHEDVKSPFSDLPYSIFKSLPVKMTPQQGSV